CNASDLLCLLLYARSFSSTSLRCRPSSPLFPYTTLFRSCRSSRRPPARRCDGAASAELSAALSCDGRGGRNHGQSDGHPHASCRSEEHTSELQSRENLVCRLLLEKKKKNTRERNCVIHR